MANNKSKTVSLVIPIYNEVDIVSRFLAALDEHLSGLELPVELVIVDDGSVDGTWPILQDYASLNDNATLLRFSRNFGKEAAIMAGLQQCRGDAAIVIDADLQHPPSLLKEMTGRWLAGDVDIVDGVKDEGRPASSLDRLTSAGFNRLFQRMTGYDMKGASDYKLLDRRVIDALDDMKSYNLFFRGATLWLGFRHAEIKFQVQERLLGNSKWSLLSRLRLAITAITSFTSLPLHLMSLVGLVSLAFAVVLGAQTMYNKFNGAAVEGFTTVILLLLIFGSVITLGLGVIGAYLSKIHDEVRGRPRYLIEETVLPGDSDGR